MSGQYVFELLLFLAVSAALYQVVHILTKNQDGVRPGYMGLLVICVTAAGMTAICYLAKRAGFHPDSGFGMETSFFLLGVCGFAVAIGELRQRRSAGAILLDTGPSRSMPVAYMLAGANLTFVLIYGPQAEHRMQAFAVLSMSASGLATNARWWNRVSRP